MGTPNDADKPAPPEDETLTDLARWLRGLVSGPVDGLEGFTSRILAVFAEGLPIQHEQAGVWYASLETINPADNQVAARVRLSRRRPDGREPVSRGVVSLGQRGRKLFADRAQPTNKADADLVLVYSFPAAFTVERNIDLFREFAGNELGRLRAG